MLWKFDEVDKGRKGGVGEKYGAALPLLLPILHQVGSDAIVKKREVGQVLLLVSHRKSFNVVTAIH